MKMKKRRQRKWRKEDKENGEKEDKENGKKREKGKWRKDVCHILGGRQSVRMGKIESKIDRETENVFNHIIQRKFPILST